MLKQAAGIFHSRRTLRRGKSVFRLCVLDSGASNTDAVVPVEISYFFEAGRSPAKFSYPTGEISLMRTAPVPMQLFYDAVA